MQVDQQLTEHNTEEMKAQEMFAKYDDEKLKRMLKTLLSEEGDHSFEISSIIKELDRRGV